MKKAVFFLAKKKKTPVGWGYKMWCSFRSSAAIHAPLVHSNLCMSQQYSEDLLILFRCIHTRLVHTIQRHTRTQIWKRLRFRCVCVCVCPQITIRYLRPSERASERARESVISSLLTSARRSASVADCILSRAPCLICSRAFPRR